MPRKYQKVTNRANVCEKNVELVINAVLDKELSIRKAAERYGLKHATLQHRLEKKKQQNNFTDNPRKFPKYPTKQVFTEEEENQLEDYITKCSAIQYGLTLKGARELAYEYASNLPNCKYPKKWDEEKRAGEDWMYGFRSRHLNLTLRKPENTNAARASAFNKHTIDEFYKNYESVLTRYSFTANRIYNLDESSVTTVQKTPKILAQRQMKQVGQIVLAERGQLVTFCAIVSADGSCIPPAFIFPRVNYKEHFINGAPEGSIGMASKSGWMSSDLFLKVLKHIQRHTNCSREQPILLLLDNHESHTSIGFVTYSKEHGIVVLSFPPHTTHRLQLLDVSIFGPFKAKLAVAFNDWHRSNPGRTVTIYDIPGLAKTAYLEAFSMKNITSGFSKPGIWPFNKLAFSDSDFSSSYVSDRQMEAVDVDISPQPSTSKQSENMPSQSASEEPSHLLPVVATAKSDLKGIVSLPEIIRPFPKAPLRKANAKGRQGKSRI